MSAKIQMKCEKCNHMEHWDNRQGKTNPKAPDFRCTNCRNGVWPSKNGNGNGQTPVAAAMTPNQGYSAGPHVPAIDGPYAPPNAYAPPVQPPAPPAHATPHPFDSYLEITEFVLRVVKPRYDAMQVGLSPEAAAAISATLYIQQQKRTAQ